MAAELIDIARLHALESERKVDYRQISAEALAAEQAASFDLVCCMEMLEHVPEPASVIAARSEEHTSELQSLMRISYAVFCLKKTNKNTSIHTHQYTIHDSQTYSGSC